MAETAIDLNATLRQAIEQHRAGRLREAEQACRQVLRQDPAQPQALTLLGPKRTRSLVLGRCLVDRMNDYPAGRLDKTYFWRRSLVGSVLSARLADALFPDLREEAFVAGLLADIGIAILANALDEQYQPIVGEYRPKGRFISEEEERECVGVTHAEISAMVLSSWGLPETICVAVNLQQSLTVQPTGPAQRIARILNTADRVARLLCELPEEQDVTVTCTEATAFIGVDLQTLAGILENIEADVQELALILRTDVIPSSVYARIAEVIQRQLLPA